MQGNIHKLIYLTHIYSYFKSYLINESKQERKKLKTEIHVQNERNKENSQNMMLQYVPYAYPLSVDEIGLSVGTF